MEKIYKTTINTFYGILIAFFLSFQVFAQVPNCATALLPGSGATITSSSPTFSWTAPTGTPATGYYLYLGTTTAANQILNGIDIGTTNPYTYTTTTLNCGATYYWKIVPYNGVGPATGCVAQSFKMPSAPTIAIGTVAIGTCSNSASVNITVPSAPTNTPNSTWTSSGTGTFGTVTFSSGVNPSTTYAPSASDISAGSVVLTLTASGYGNCTAATSTKTLTISPAPSVSSGTAITACSTVPVNITAGSSASNYGTITWTTNGGGAFTNNNSLTATTYTPIASDAGTKTLTLTATGIGACATVTSTKNIVTGNTPTAIAGTAVGICSNVASVNITAGSSSTNAANITWSSSGTGTVNNPSNITTATYAPSPADITAGSVTITLTANPNGSCTAATSTKTLTISPAPSVSSGTAIAGCSTVPVNITAGSSASNYNTITWTTNGTGTFGSNGSVTATAYTPSASDVGTKTLTLTATGIGTCATVTSTKNIVTGNTPTAIAGTAIGTCSNAASVNITAGSSSTNAASITWSSSGTGTFNNPSNITTATYAPSPADITAGSVTITLTANPNGSCIAATSTKTLTISPAPSVASGTAIATCGTGAVNITTGSSASNYGTITWTTSNGGGAFTNNNSLTATTYTPTIGDVTAGTRLLTLTATGIGTCLAVTSTKNITLSAMPTAVAGTAITMCSSTASAVIGTGATSTNNSGITWTSSGTGAFTNSTVLTTAAYSPSAADIAAGTVTLTLTANGNGACTPVTSTKALTITTLPVATFSYTGTPYCNNTTNPFPTFSGAGVGGVFSSTTGLNFVSTSTGQVNLATSTANTYTVTNTIAAAGGCPVVTATSPIAINTVPVITVQPANVATCIGNSGNVTFTVTATGTGLAYQWLENGVALTNTGIYSGVTTNTLTLTGVTASNNYSVVVSGACSPSVTSSAATLTVYTSAPGTPSVFGNGVWNAYCYGAINFTSYAGYYVEPSLSFDSRLRWASGASPSIASGYQGCFVPATNMSISFKQTNFTPGTYNLSVNFQDDGFTMFLNGTQVFQNTGYTPALQSNVWTGTLGASDQVELRYTQGGGGSGLMVTFAPITTPANSITAGTIAGNQSICSGEIPTQVLSNVASAVSTGCSLGSYQWQSSTDSLTWTPIIGANSTTYTIPATLTATTWYSRIANGGCGATATSNPVKVSVFSMAPGNPTVYGNGVWNCYAYTLQTFGTYKGYYVEPLLSFDTRNRWSSGTAPSLVSGYQGCLVPATQMSISMKQTNFTPGFYSLSVNYQDDGFTMLINGVQVFQNTATTSTLQSNVWTGQLNAASQVELRYSQATGNSGLAVTFAPYTPPTLQAGTIGGAGQHICSGETPQLPLSNITPASGGCTWRANSYQWQSSLDSLTWTNISGATATSYTIPGTLTADTYYQRTITDDCAQTAASNVIKVSLNDIVYGDPTVFGTNQWNVYAYKGITFANYAGYYVEPSASFQTTNRYTTTQSPSYASGYLGCNVPITNFATSMKRQGVPSSSTGIFQIDIASLDDVGTLIIDGTQVYTKNCCVAAATPLLNIWTGPLTASSQIEWRWVGLTSTNFTGLTFTEITPTALLPGTITGSDTICTGNKPTLGFTTTSLPSGGCNFSYYQWQYSTDSLTWINLSGSNSASYVPVLSIYQKTYFRRVAYDICGTAAATLPTVINMRTNVPGNPSVYGNNTWNAYCYNDAAYGQYVGFYTENNLSFDTKNRYLNSQPPSTALPSGGSLGFSGCQQLYTYWSLDLKRKGLGSNPDGYYQIDINWQDDGAALLINGAQVFQSTNYTPSLQSNVWTGLINSTTLLELKLYNNAGPGSIQVTFTYLGPTPPTNLVAGTLACNPSTFCSGDLPYVNSATPASGGCTANYQWQSSPDGTTWSNITGATSLNFNSITAITATTYYRRTATDGCGNSVNTAACMLTTGATIANPGVGNNTWNCLVYNATDFTSNYSGYYTEPLLSFATINRFSNTSPPSYASGYLGCQSSAATYSVRMLRTNFSPATYQIDIPTHDDNMYLIINGVQVFSSTCCGANLTAWTGNLGATDVVELRYSNNFGTGNLSATFTVVTPTGTLIPSVIGADQLICNAAVPAQLTTVTAATSFCYLSYQWQSSTISISGGYTNISGATLTNYSPAALSQTTYYRLLINDACGNTAFSNAITITVNAAVVATTNGTPQTICSGQIPTAITATPGGGNGSYTYLWQSSTTGPATGFTSTGVTAATYAPAAITQSTWYRVSVTSCGATVTSASNAVTVAPATAITTQPVNQIGCIGTTGTFTLAATGYNINYQWQEKINAGAFTNTGTNSNTFSNIITAAMGTNTYTYQCIITSICAPTSVTSNSVTLTPNTAPSITAQPVAATTCSGSATPVTFSITATSATGYQWYNATGNVMLTNTGIYSGVTTPTLTITGATVATSYYCVISGTPACVGTTQSSSAVLTVRPVIATNTISSNQTICANATVTALTGTTPTGGGGAGTYTYQWSSSTDNVTYNPITGATTANYTPTGVTVTTYFKRTVSSTTCVVNTTATPVTITVNPQPATPTITGTVTYCAGATFSLTGSSTTGGSTYAWTAPGTATGLSGAATATVSKAIVQTTEAGTYSVRATAAGCTSLPGSAVVVVNRLPAITVQPAATTGICAATGGTISVTTTGTGLTYQWQQSSDGVAPFTNIVNNGVYNNATTANLLLYPTASINGYYFRCVISGTCAPPVTSSNSVLTVYTALIANTVATAQEICGGSTPATLTGSVPTGGTGTYLYQWYTSIDNNTFTALSGSTSQNYSPGPLTQNTWYYRIATSPSTGNCATNTSSTLLITVDPSTDIPTQPNNTSTCPSVSTTMSLVATGAGLTYRWQVNPLTGVYTNVSNASLYSGYTTNTLTFTNPSASMNGYLYRCIVTGNCAAGGYSIDTSTVAVLNINSPATINTQPASYNVCTGANVTYTVGATGSLPLTYQWQQRIAPGAYVNLSDGGIVSGATTSSLSLSNVPVSYNGYYYRCAITMNGCVINTLSTNGLLSVKAVPTVSASANPATICAGQSSNLTALGANTYVWSTAQTTNPISVTPASATTYTVTGTAANGCTNTGSVTVTVNPLITPSVTISPSPSSVICSGNSVTFSTNPVNGGASPSFQWKVNGVNATTNSPSNTSYANSSLNNNDIVSVVMTSNVACGSPLTVTSNAITMTVNPRPTITTAATAASVCYNAAAQSSSLSYSVTNNTPINYSITWNSAAISAGLGNVSSTSLPASPITVPLAASVAGATYTGTLFVTNANTCSSAGNSFTLTVNPLVGPVGSIAGPTTVCLGQTGIVYSIAAVANAATYNWTVPAGAAVTAGAGSTSITLSYATASVISGSVSVVASNTCAATSTNSVTVTIDNTCFNIWTGNSSIDWHTASNWNLGFVPTSVDDVTIPSTVASGRMPTISTNANTKSLTNNGAITFTSTGALNAYGNIANSGTVTTVAGSTVAFNGASAQSITGVPVLHNVVINNTSSGVSLGSAVTVKGTLSLTKGVLTTNSNLTINFDNGGNIAYASTDLGSISGDVSGRRDASAKTHYMSVPFNGVTSAQVQATTPLFVNPYWKMYTKTFAAQNWAAVTNTTTAMPMGTGYSLSLPAAAPLIFTGTYNHAYTLTGENYSNAAATKYFMLGNPYPSTLDWDNASGWTKTNVANAIYYWDAPNSRAASYVAGVGTNGATRYIPAMQSVLISTTGSAVHQAFRSITTHV